MKYNILLILILILASCSSPKPRKPVSRSTSTFLKKSIDRNKALNKIEENYFKKIMQNDTLNKYHKSNTGFWYFYNKKETTNSKLPVKGDLTVINYEIRDLNNNVIFTQEELGSKGQKNKKDRLYKIDSEEFITGLQEGIKLMHVGDKITFLFPSNKVFGITGFQDKISPNQPLIIEILLKEIK